MVIICGRPLLLYLKRCFSFSVIKSTQLLLVGRMQLFMQMFDGG